jgi:dihydroorotate dehydrogenase electron transfer subunit
LYQELAPIISNQEIIPGINLMWIESTQITSTARPGQFIMIKCDDENNRLLRRPISIYQVNKQSFGILFARVGSGTNWLAQRRSGEKLNLLGPIGNGFSIERESKKLLLVAGGIGVAPLCFLANSAIGKGLKVKLLLGARTACQIFPEHMLPTGCEIMFSTEDGTIGEKGMVTTLLPRCIDWADQIFACGPLPMLKALSKDYVKFFQDKPVQTSLEVRMGCGLGFCYACTIKTRQGLKQVCRDGPVFDINDVIWDEISIHPA